MRFNLFESTDYLVGGNRLLDKVAQSMHEAVLGIFGEAFPVVFSYVVEKFVKVRFFFTTDKTSYRSVYCVPRGRLGVCHRIVVERICKVRFY